MDGMKLDVINREHQGLIFPAWRLVLSVTSKRIILPESHGRQKNQRRGRDGGRVFTLGPYLRCS